MALSRTEALNLSANALEMGADVLRGHLQKAREGSEWDLGDTDLTKWLERYEGQDLLIIVAPVGPASAERHVCRTCGTEYVGNQCPHCREVRLRLRGRE